MKIELLGKDTFVARSTFDERMIPKQAGFRWNPAQKVWWTDDPEKAAKLAEYCDEAASAVIKEALAKKEILREASRATDADIDVPAPDGLSYLPFQRGGIAYAMSRETVLIGDEMGLGKTIQALGIINADANAKSVLIICPASLRLNWKREAEKWLVRPMTVEVAGNEYPTADVVIINYDILKKHKDNLRIRQWDVMICDECHYLKNPKAQRTVEVLGKWDADPAKKVEPINARRKIFLTGTPIVNRPVEIFTVLRSSGLPEFRSWKFFVIRYCAGHRNGYGWDVSGASNLEELQKKLRETLMVRRLKKDVLADLPAKRRQIIEFPANGSSGVVKAESDAWTGHQKTMISLQAAVELAKASEDRAEYDNAVQALKEGMQVAFTEMAKLRHATALAKVPAVVEHIINNADSSGKVVLFAHHKDVIAAVESALNACEIQNVKVTGDMGAEARQESVDRFQNEEKVKVFIGSIHAAGVGLTLTAASHVVFAELDWVPGNMSQAEDRCHRIGQTESVLVQHLVLEGSMDAEMARMLVEKQAIIDEALDKNVNLDSIKSWGSMISIGKPASRNITREAVATEAEQLTDEEVEVIHAKLKRIAAACDYAEKLDGVGFSAFDAEIGHSLAGALQLTHKQAVIGKKLVHKYRRQLGEK